MFCFSLFDLVLVWNRNQTEHAVSESRATATTNATKTAETRNSDAKTNIAQETDIVAPFENIQSESSPSLSNIATNTSKKNRKGRRKSSRQQRKENTIRSNSGNALVANYCIGDAKSIAVTGQMLMEKEAKASKPGSIEMVQSDEEHSTTYNEMDANRIDNEVNSVQAGTSGKIDSKLADSDDMDADSEANGWDDESTLADLDFAFAKKRVIMTGTQCSLITHSTFQRFVWVK